MKLKRRKGKGKKGGKKAEKERKKGATMLECSILLWLAKEMTRHVVGMSSPTKAIQTDDVFANGCRADLFRQ